MCIASASSRNQVQAYYTHSGQMWKGKIHIPSHMEMLLFWGYLLLDHSLVSTRMMQIAYLSYIYYDTKFNLSVTLF